MLVAQLSAFTVPVVLNIHKSSHTCGEERDGDMRSLSSSSEMVPQRLHASMHQIIVGVQFSDQFGFGCRRKSAVGVGDVCILG